jgi:hypothetical protein
MGGNPTLPQSASGHYRFPMRPWALRTAAISCMLATGCSYNVETLARCFDNVEPSLRAVKQVVESGAYRGGQVALRHTLCSTDEDRLAVAERLLAASGYQYVRRVAELGRCTDVRLKSPLTSQAVQRQVTTFCGVAAAAGVAYTAWSGGIGDHFLYVSGKYISLTRRGELPKPM